MHAFNFLLVYGCIFLTLGMARGSGGSCREAGFAAPQRDRAGGGGSDTLALAGPGWPNLAGPSDRLRTNTIGGQNAGG